jgi:Tfp pilus assembly protein PilN
MGGFNLLPPEHRTRRGARFVPVSFLVVAVIAVTGVALMELGVVTRATGTVGGALRETLADRHTDLEAARRERSAVDAEIAGYTQILSQTPVWSNLLIDVAAAVAPGVRIEHWSADAERGVCSIQGRAATNGDVFKLVTALEGIEEFESVKLAGVAKETDAKGQGVRYEIVCELRQAPR